MSRRASRGRGPSRNSLSEPFELHIGGLCFSLEPRSGVRMIEDDATYRDFLRPREMPGEVRIPVDLELGEAPDLWEDGAVFDAGTWMAWRTDGETILRLRASEGPDPYLWVARMELAEKCEKVTVYCGSLLVDRGEKETVIQSPLHYPLDQLLAIHFLAPRRGLICHAAGLALRGRGALFAGPSGAGKTTFSRLFRARPEILGLSDDRVILRGLEDGIFIYGTPWAGEGRLALNRAFPLQALVFLHQAEKNALRPITSRAALEQLFPVLSILWFDPESMESATSFCGELVASIPAYELHFRPEPSALDLLDKIL